MDLMYRPNNYQGNGMSDLAASTNQININYRGMSQSNFQAPPKQSKNPWQPYLLTRGASAILGEISGRKERQRQDDYYNQQMADMNQMNAMPVEDFQPNPYMMYAQFGGKLQKYQAGGRLVNQVPQGYKQLRTEGNRTYYGMESSGVNVAQAQAGKMTNDPAQYEQLMMQKVKSGISPEELASKGYISRENVAKFSPYFNSDLVYTEMNPQSTAGNPNAGAPIVPQQAFRGEPVYEGNKLIGFSRFNSRNSANQGQAGALNTQEQFSEFMYADNMGKPTGDLYTVPAQEWSNTYTGGTRHLKTRDGLEKYKANQSTVKFRKGGKYRGNC